MTFTTGAPGAEAVEAEEAGGLRHGGDRVPGAVDVGVGRAGEGDLLLDAEGRAEAEVAVGAQQRGL